MAKKIKDEFAQLPISRQRKYQLRKQRERRCPDCGAPVVWGSRCLKHLAEARERLRARNGTRRRYNTFIYRVQTDPKAALREIEKLKTQLSRKIRRRKARAKA